MKRATLFMAVAAAALLSVGCSIQKRCQAPDLNLPETIVEGAVDSLTMADMDWWEVYADSTLCDLIRRTLDRNKDMLTAEANVRRMAELYRIDKTALLPSMSGLVVGDRETNAYYGEKSTVDPELSVKATISWEADLWGNLRWAKRRALAEYLASVEGARAMRMTLIAQVATAYFELVALDQELDIVRRTVAAREESLAQAQLRFEGGVTSEIPYQQAKVELARSAAMIPDLEMEITQKENEISLLAGGYPSVVERADSLDAAMPENSGVGLPSTLLQRRPDIREAEESLRAAMADVGIAYADRFPRLRFTVTGGVENDALRGLISSPFSYLSGQLAGPIFSFGAKRAKYRAAMAAYDASRLGYEQKVLTAFREVNDAIVAYRSASRSAELKRNLREASRKYVELTQLQYISGDIRYIDFLDAERSFFDAQVEVNKAVLAKYLALVELYKALGGGWQSEEKEA